MRKIVAIGGGEIARPGCPGETLAIDQEILSLAHTKKPRLLFIPTASSDSESYIECIERYFGQKLGCQVSVLRLINASPSHHGMQELILSADIIYVGGGNTLKMMTIWRAKSVNKLLMKAHAKGTVLCGVSAGSICWFREGNSDSRQFTSGSTKLIKVTGLGFIPALHCPHYDVEAFRQADLRRMMKRTPGVSIALDNCCALEVVGDDYRVISSRATANAYKIYWRRGEYCQELIDKEIAFRPLRGLLERGNPN